MSAKAYGDGGFFFLQPVTSPRQVVSSYGDGGFYFIEPLTSPRQVVSSYGAFHVSQGFGAAPQRPKSDATAIGGMRVPDKSGRLVQYPCPRPGVTYDPKLDPCGEKPWWLTPGQWNEYRLTGKFPEAKKEDPKCAELVAKYNAAKNPIIRNTIKAQLKAAGCSIPRPGTGIDASPPGGGGMNDIDKEEVSLETEEASFWETYKWPLIGLGAAAAVGGTVWFFLRK